MTQQEFQSTLYKLILQINSEDKGLQLTPSGEIQINTQDDTDSYYLIEKNNSNITELLLDSQNHSLIDMLNQNQDTSPLLHCLCEIFLKIDNHHESSYESLLDCLVDLHQLVYKQCNSLDQTQTADSLIVQPIKPEIKPFLIEFLTSLSIQENSDESNISEVARKIVPESTAYNDIFFNVWDIPHCLEKTRGYLAGKLVEAISIKDDTPDDKKNTADSTSYHSRFSFWNTADPFETIGNMIANSLMPIDNSNEDKEDKEDSNTQNGDYSITSRC